MHRFESASFALVPALLLHADGAPVSGRRSALDLSTLTVVERSTAQDQGGWVIHYLLRYQGPSVSIAPSDISAKLEGWVSNSRVCSHAMPRWSELFVSGTSGLTGTADVVASADEAARCRERVVVRVWTDEPAVEATAPAAKTSTEPRPARNLPPALMNLTPGSTVRVRLKLEHLHFLYGDYDPLLGGRASRAAPRPGHAPRRAAARPRAVPRPGRRRPGPSPPEDRRDTRHFVSGPDSLHLEAHIPGNQYYRFSERPVRYGTKMRLSYWYFIAPGTEGECRARIAQYKDTPTAWKILSDGAHEECLTRVGRWVKVERVFRTECDATSLALDFQIISSTDIGEMWIDDVTLEPVRGGCASRP